MRKSVLKNVLLSVFFAIFMAASIFGLALSNVLPKRGAKAETTWQTGLFEMDDGASLKLGEVGGLRFIVRMDETVANFVKENDSAELGFVIAPKNLMLEANGDYLNMSKKIGGAIDKNKIYQDGDDYCANGCITNIKQANLERSFTAVAYIKYNGEVRYTEYNDLARNNLYDTVNMAALYGYADAIFNENAGGYAQAGENEGWFGSDQYPIMIENSEEYTALVDIANKQNIDLSSFHVVVKNNATPSYGFANSEFKPASIISNALYTVNGLIQALPDTMSMPNAIGFVAKIHDIEEQYEALTDVDKAEIENYAKLESLLNVIEGYDRVYKNDATDGTVIASHVPNYTSTVSGTATTRTDEVYGNVLTVTSDAEGKAALHFKNFPSIEKYAKIYFYVKVDVGCKLYLSDGITNDGWGANWKNTWSVDGYWCNVNTWRLVEIDPADGYIGTDFALGFRADNPGFTFEISDFYGIVSEKYNAPSSLTFGSLTDAGTHEKYGQIYNLTQSWDSAVDLGSIGAGQLKAALADGHNALKFWIYNPAASEVSLFGSCAGHNWAREAFATLAPNAWTEVIITPSIVSQHDANDLCICVRDASDAGVAKTAGWQISKIYSFYDPETRLSAALEFGAKTDTGTTNEYGKVYNISREQWYVENNVNNTIGTLQASKLANALPAGYEYFYFWMYNPTDTTYNFHLAGGNTWTDSADSYSLTPKTWTKIIISAADIQLNTLGGNWYVYILGGDGAGAAKDGWQISTIYAGPDKVEQTEIVYLDHADVKEAIALINAIPETVTTAGEAAIKAARAAYDTLTDAQKAMVSNASKLTAAETTLADVKITEAVIKLIDSIDENNINATLVAQAREQYDLLSDEAKTTFDANKLRALERYEAVSAVNVIIASLPTINMPTDIYRIQAVQEAQAAYDALSYDCKEMVSGYDKLMAASSAIADYEVVYVPTAGTINAIPGSAPGQIGTVAATGAISVDETYGTIFTSTSGTGGRASIQFNNFPDISHYEKVYFYVRTNLSTVANGTEYLYIAEDTGNDGWGTNWKNNWNTNIEGKNSNLTSNDWILMEFSTDLGYFTSNWTVGIYTKSGATNYKLEIASIIGFGKQAEPEIPTRVEVSLNVGQMTDTGTTNEYGKVYNLKRGQWFIDNTQDPNNLKTMTDFQANVLANALPDGYDFLEFYLYNPTATTYQFHLAGGDPWTDSQYFIDLTPNAWTRVFISADEIEMNKTAAWYMYILGGNSDGAAQEGWKMSSVYAVMEEDSGEQATSKTETGINFGVATESGESNEYGTVYNLSQAGWVLGDGNTNNDGTDMGAFNQGVLRNALQGNQEILAFWIKNPNDRGVQISLAGGSVEKWETFTYLLPANAWTLVRVSSDVIALNDSYTVYVSVSYGANTSGWQISPVYAYAYNDWVKEITTMAQELINALDVNAINEANVTAARSAYEALTETEKAQINATALIECEAALYGNVTNASFIENFETQYKIYYAAGNKEAATFMQEQLNAVTGVYLSVVSATPTNLTKYRYAIILGHEDLAAELGFDCPTEEEIGTAGYAIKRIGRTVFILARGKDGYRMGMLAFLRETIGYEMISEDCIIYNTENVDIMPALDLIEKPSFDYRQKQTAMSDTEVYGMGLQSHTDLWISAPDTRGKGCWDMHNVLDYLSEDVYKASHPTWFYTKKDSAGTQRTQICPTAGGTSAEFNAMVDAIAANMLARINQEVGFATVENICISTMDSAGGDYCTCSRCSLYNTLYGEGGFAAAWIDLMNAVNAKIRESLPQDRVLNIAFLAYRDTEVAPANIDGSGNVTLMKRYQINDNGSYTQTNEDLKCDDGVTVWLAPINASYAENFNHADNATHLATIKKWCAISDSVYLWMYGTNFKYFLYPYNTWQASAENYKILAELGVKGVWSQSIEKESTAFTDLKSYIDSKFMANVNADYETVLNTYFTNYFGPAAAKMREMFDTLVAQCEALEAAQNGLGRGIYDELEYETGWLIKTKHSYWSETNLNTLLTLCNEAKAAVNASSLTDEQKTAILNRITKESLFPRYVLCNVYGNTSDREQFKKDCEALGVTVYNEAGGSIQSLW